jgi:tetratricopeptide (TPR) repeat protein
LKGDPKLTQLWQAGVEAQQQNKLAAAATAYQELLRIQPQAYPAHVNLALVLLRQKQNAKAVWHLRRATAIAPQELQPRVMLAQTYLYLKAPRDSFKQWTQVAAMSQGQNNLKPLYIQAVMAAGSLALEQLKDLPSAEVWLRRANVALDGRDPRTAMMLSQVLSTRGKHSEAAQVLQKTSQQYPKVIEIQTALAQAQWAAKDQDGAIRTLRGLERQIPATQNKGLALSQVRIMLGRALAQKQEYSGAINLFQSAIALLPKNSPALPPTQALLAQTFAGQAASLEKQKKLADAATAWSRAAALFPKNPTAYLQRGRLFQKLEQNSSALQEYRRALQLIPTEPNALLQVAQLEEKSGDASRAGKYWQALIAARPEFKPAYFGLMDWAARQQQLSQQLPFLAARADKTPDERALYEAVAISFGKAGKGDEARKWLESVVKKHPNTNAPNTVLRAMTKSALNPTAIPTPVIKATPTAAPQTKPTPAPSATRTPIPETTPKVPGDTPPHPRSNLPKSTVVTPVRPVPTPIKPNPIVPRATPTLPNTSLLPESDKHLSTQPTDTTVRPDQPAAVQ